MKGYDLDGVITAGIKPDRRGVIITGRSFEEAAETYNYLRGLGIFNAVYFNPVTFQEKTLENSAMWKVHMMKLLGVKEFREDDQRQIDVMEPLVACNIIKC